MARTKPAAIPPWYPVTFYAAEYRYEDDCRDAVFIRGTADYNEGLTPTDEIMLCRSEIERLYKEMNDAVDPNVWIKL